MARIERPAALIAAALEGVAAQDRCRLPVACAAKRLQFAEPKGIRVAAMGRDMVGDLGPSVAAVGAAHVAERLDPELMAGAVAPALKLVPFAPMAGLVGIGAAARH